MSQNEPSWLDDDETPDPPEDEKDRNRAGYLERQLKKRDKELEELRAFKQTYEREQAERKVQGVFESLQLDPKRSSWFRADNPEAEPTPDAVKAWAVSEGLLEAGDVPAPASGFTPTTTPDAAALGARKLTSAEWIALAASDPAEAQRVFAAGKVDRSDVRRGLGPQR